MKKTDKDSKDLQNEWTSGKQWIDNFTRDFTELDNLADGVALNSDPKAPQVGSMTLPADIRQIPRASIQQLPTFSVEVNGTKISIPAFVCDYIVRRVVFNQDTFGKGILSTLQIGAESALTRGFQAFMCSLGTSLSDFGTTLKQIHYNDIVVETGIFDAGESSKYKVRTRVTKSRLKKLIKDAKANPNTTWVVSELETLLETGGSHDNYESYESSPRYNAGITGQKDTYDIIADYGTGPFYDITTFTMDTEKPLRELKSRSKFGYPRVQFLVLDPAQLSPFGISRARLASPWANYANIFLQSTAKMMLFNADPPVFQKGQFTTPVTLKRAALWQTLDPNADVKLQEMSNSTMSQFQMVLNQADSQIHAIMGVTPGSSLSQNTGSTYQNSVSSKMEQSTRDMSVTQITHILENFLRQYALTALDLYISEQEGETGLIVDDKCKNSINQFARKKHEEVTPLDPMTGMPATPFNPPIGDDNTITINWDDFYLGKVVTTEVQDPMTGQMIPGEPQLDENGEPVRKGGIQTWTIDIDLSMSKDNLDDKKRADMQDMLTVSSQTADPNNPQDMQFKNELQTALVNETLPEMARNMQSQPPQTPPMMPNGLDQ